MKKIIMRNKLNSIFKHSLYSLLFVLLFSSALSGQNTDVGYLDHAPKSPEAAALINFQDIPVGHYSGLPQVNVPITTFSSRDIQIPISLSYHSGGHRVSEIANWVGLGWKLNGGGMITRKVRGLPDDFVSDQGLDEMKGFLSFRSEKTFSEVQSAYNSNASSAQLDLLNLMATGCYDAEPDEFYFDALGYSGKFVFDWDESKDEGKPVVISESKVKIESYSRDASNQRIDSWVLLLPNGIRLTFSEVETTFVNPQSAPTSCNSLPYTYHSGWYLSGIESSSVNGHAVNLSYVPFSYTRSFVSHSKTFLDGSATQCSGSVSGEFNGSTSLQTITGKRLSSISSTEGYCRLEVVSTTTRTDTEDLLQVSNFNRLDEIILYGKNNKVKTKHRLNYEQNTSRLQLSSVEQIGREGGVLPSYEFSYNPTQMPSSINSHSVDHWGFYNGAANTQLVPTFERVMLNGNIVVYEGADRNPYEDYSKASVLEQITYPTGAIVNLNYELNDYGRVGPALIPSLKQLDRHLVLSATGDDSNPGQVVSTQTSFVINTQQSVKVDFSGATWVTFGPFYPKYRILDANGTVVNSGFIPPPSDGVSVPNNYSETLYLSLNPGEYTLVCEAQDYAADQQAHEDFIIVKLDYYEILPGQNETKKLAGGVRVKSITTFDPYSGETMLKEYSYTINGNETKSSGVINGEPAYFYRSSSLSPIDGQFVGRLCNYTVLKSNTSLVYGSEKGSHIGYKEVTVSYGANGKYGKHTYYYSSSEDYPNTINDDLPFGDPLSQEYKRGLLLKEQIYTKDGFLSQETDYDYDYINIDINSAKVAFRVSNNGLFGTYQEWPISDRLASWFQPIRMGYTKQISSTTTSYFNGSESVVENKTYTYDDNLQLLKEEFITNSDGEIHSTAYQYAEDEPSGNVINCMIDRNMVGIPIRTINRVDGTDVGGTWTEFRVYGSNCGNILPEHTYTLWEDWVKITDILEYTSDWYPRRVESFGGNITEYTWTEGMVSKKEFLNWTWDYDYDYDLRLFEEATNLDGQVLNYSYDEFNRLELIRGRNDNIQTSFDYSYGNPNTVTTTQTFSDAPMQVTTQSYDGLSRFVKMTHNGIVKDEKQYDDGGRIERETYLVGSFTEHLYEASPLNRLLRSTFPDNNYIEKSYGGEDNFYKVITTNEKGNAFTKLTDILGRGYKSIDPMNGQTIYEYDNRSNLKQVTAPNGSQYIYTYDDRSRLLSKKIPGQEQDHIYRYNDADNFLDYTIDPAGNRMDYRYDDYDRERDVRLNRLGDNFDASISSTWGGPGDIIINNYYAEDDANASTIETGKMLWQEARLLLPNGSLGNFTRTTYGYDNFGRIENQEEQYYLGNVQKTDNFVTTFNHADWVLSQNHNHNGYIGETISSTYGYDIFGRQMSRLFGAGQGQGMGFAMTYNDKDQMTSKKFAPAGASYLDRIVYQYNDRGWLTRMNDPLLDLSDLQQCEEEELVDDCYQSEEVVSIEQLLAYISQGEQLAIEGQSPCSYDDCYESLNDVHMVFDCSTIIEDLDFNESGVRPAFNFPYVLPTCKECEYAPEVITQSPICTSGNVYVELIISLPGGGGNGWLLTTAEGASYTGDYGVSSYIGPIFASSESIEVFIADRSNPECKASYFIDVPSSCVPEDCIIFANYENLTHLDINGTPNDKTDDLYSFDLVVNSSHNVGETGWKTIINGEEYEYAYGTTTRISNLPYTSLLSVTITDISDPTCDRSFYVNFNNSQSVEDIQNTPIVPSTEEDDLNTFENDLRNWLITKGYTFSKVKWEKRGDRYVIIVSNTDLKVESATISCNGGGTCNYDILYYPSTIAPCSEAILTDAQSSGDGYTYYKLETAGGSTYWLEEEQLRSLTGDYEILYRLDANNPRNTITVVDGAGQEQTIQASQLVSLGSQAADLLPVRDVDEDPCSPNCSYEPLNCSEAEQQAQQESLAEIHSKMGWIDPSELQYPVNIDLVRLCDGSVTYILRDLLGDLEGLYLVLDNIQLSNINAEIDIVISRKKPIWAMSFTHEANGNIKKMSWKVTNHTKKYYENYYDPLDRLNYAVYGQEYLEEQSNGDIDLVIDQNNHYTMGAGYDAVGNITNLFRQGMKPTSECFESGTIDLLGYSYENDRLKSVSDKAPIDFRMYGFKPNSGANNSLQTYFYDKNGNMTSDTHKGLTIEYNHLNLPSRIIGGSGEIQITYDALGRKWRKVSPEGIKDYVLGIEYQDQLVESIYEGGGEGRVVPNDQMVPSSGYRAEYWHQDHLGNTRLTFSDYNNNLIVDYQDDPNTTEDESEITSENHYYPFGLNQIGDWYATTSPENKYQYNGKELNEELGLNWMDYEARYYDPAIGRFGQIDPLADSFPSWASYTYTLNNPILFVDPDGKAPCPHPCSEVKGRIENLAKPIKEGLEQAGDYISGLLSDAKNAIKGLFPDQGTPDAEDFHDSGDEVNGGVEELSNSGLNAEGTAETPPAKDGATVIIEQEDLQTNGTGISGDFIKDYVGQPANAIHKTINAIDKAKQARKESKKLDKRDTVKVKDYGSWKQTNTQIKDENNR